MLLPCVAVVLIFKYLPLAGLSIAFQDYSPIFGIFYQEWCGLDNFRYVFSLPTFPRVIYNTMFIAIMKIVAGIIVPVTFALMLNEMRNIHYKRTLQTVVYLPHFISWVALAGIFLDVLSMDGIVNKMLGVLGITPVYFLGDEKVFPYTMVVTDIWKNVGWSSILYLATISGIDPALYEAATVDGASRWQCTRYITLPSLVSTIVVMLILNIGSIMDAGFDQVFNLYNSAVYQTGDIIDTYVYRYGIGDMKYSLATAVGLFKNVIAFVLVVGTNLIARRISGEGIW